MAEKKDIVQFMMGVKEKVSLEDAIEALQQANKKITVMDNIGEEVLLCSAPGKVYETTFSTTLGKKMCTYTAWPSMQRCTHEYVANLSPPKLPKTLEQYFEFVDDIGGHKHLSGGRR